MKNCKIKISYVLIICSFCFQLNAQILVEWNYKDTNPTHESPLESFWLDSNNNICYIYIDDDKTFFNLNKVNESGNNIYSEIFTFTATYNFYDQYGYASDAFDNVYSWGWQSDLVKFDPDFEVEWLYDFPDSVGLQDDSFEFDKNGNIIVVTRSEYKHQVWKINTNGDFVDQFNYPTGILASTFPFFEIYNDTTYVLSYGSDSLKLWMSDISDKSYHQKNITGIHSFPSGMPKLYGNDHIMSSDGDIYLWLTRIDDTGNPLKILIKVNSAGDSLFTFQYPLPENIDILGFTKIFLNTANDKIITIDAYDNENDSVFAFVNVFDTSGTLLLNKELIVSNYFNATDDLNAIYNHSNNKVYFYIHDIGVDSTGIISLNENLEIENIDTLNVAYNNGFAESHMLIKNNGKVVLVNEVENPVFWRSIELTQLNDITTSISQIPDNNFNLTPMPIHDHFKVTSKLQGELSLYNMYGSKLSTHQVNNNTEINTIRLEQGVYFFIFTNDDKIIKSGKIIKL